MKSIAQRRRKENNCFNYNKRLLLEGYLLGKKGYPKIQNHGFSMKETSGADKKFKDMVKLLLWWKDFLIRYQTVGKTGRYYAVLNRY